MPKRRSTERFKYRNAAVMQGTILGDEKLVLITCAEFCNDSGIFWHGLRSLAKATGLGYGTIQRRMDSLRKRGVLKLLRRGTGRFLTNKYQIILDRIPVRPSVYDLVKHNREAEDDRPTMGRLEPEPIRNGSQPIQDGSKDVDLDVDLCKEQDGDHGAASQPSSCSFRTLVESPNQNQDQNQSEVNGGMVTATLQRPPALSLLDQEQHPPMLAAVERPNVSAAAPSNFATRQGHIASLLCQDCHKRPVWRGRWCDHCHAEGPYVQ